MLSVWFLSKWEETYAQLCLLKLIPRCQSYETFTSNNKSLFYKFSKNESYEALTPGADYGPVCRQPRARWSCPRWRWRLAGWAPTSSLPSSRRSLGRGPSPTGPGNVPGWVGWRRPGPRWAGGSQTSGRRLGSGWRSCSWSRKTGWQKSVPENNSNKWSKWPDRVITLGHSSQVVPKDPIKGLDTTVKSWQW